MILEKLDVYPVAIGERLLFTFAANGPASYTAAAGDPVNLPSGIYLDNIQGIACAVSQNYVVLFFPSATRTGRPSWTARWYVTAGAEVNGPTDLSAETIQFNATGGNF